MKYDLIIACGDSFTEGCQEVLGIPIESTWPGLLATKLGIPFVNLAHGGSCNLDIAMQPLNNASLHDLQKIQAAKNPLILFNFTVMERIPYPSIRAGYTESCWSILPEHTSQLGISWMDTPIKEMTVENFVNDDVPSHLSASMLNQNDNYKGRKDIDWFVFSTTQAIRLCMSWEKLIKGSTVRWGFIHMNTGTFGNDLTDYLLPGGIEHVRIKYPHIDKCYNVEVGMKELQCLMYDENLEMKDEYIISKQDIHPNREGIKLFSNWFLNYINEKI